MGKLEDYSYLWDGSDPGWVLLRTRKQNGELTLVFPSGSPSVRDIASMRAALPEFAKQAPAKVIAMLKGVDRFRLGSYDLREARRLSNACQKLGLLVELMSTDASSCLLYHQSRKVALLIEEDDMNSAVCEAALARGIRVVEIET